MEPWEVHALDCEIRDASAVTDDEHDHDATLGLPNFDFASRRVR
jgi:hypothetical protein